MRLTGYAVGHLFAVLRFFFSLFTKLSVNISFVFASFSEVADGLTIAYGKVLVLDPATLALKTEGAWKCRNR